MRGWVLVAIPHLLMCRIISIPMKRQKSRKPTSKEEFSLSCSS